MTDNSPNYIDLWPPEVVANDVWYQAFFHHKDEILTALPDETPKKFLEVGAHEGLSTALLIINAMQEDDTLDVVDLWENADHAFELCKENIKSVSTETGEPDENNEPVPVFKPAVNVWRENSKTFLPTLTADSYHFIYLDGSHATADVRIDLANAWVLLKTNGILLCDDYDWDQDDSSDNSPKTAIDEFLANNSNTETIFSGQQICIRKT